MDIDLTKYPLEELQAKITKIKNGRPVIIYSNSAAGEYPIHGSRTNPFNNKDYVECWTASGRYYSPDNNWRDLDISALLPKTVDFSKFPVDTLISVSVESGKTELRRVKSASEHMVTVFADGGCSKTAKGRTESHLPIYCKLIEGDILPWFGGEQPVPDNVEVKAWRRGGAGKNWFAAAKAGDLSWLHAHAAKDVVLYQITGNIL